MTTAEINAEGIDRPKDLFEYSKDDLNSVFKNLRKSLVAVVSGVIVPVAPHALSANSKKRIVMAIDATRYYVQIGKYITPSNMEWSTLANFDVQWQAMQELKKQDDTDVPKLTKSGSIIKWIESLKLHLNETVGVRNCPLVYVVREQADLTNVTRGNFMAGQPHS